MNFTTDDHYKSTLQCLMSCKLGKGNRVLYGIVCVLSLVSVLYFGSWFFKSFGDDFMALIMRLMCGVGMIFSGILSFYAGGSVLSGKIRGRFYPGFIFGSAIILLGYYCVALFYMVFIAPVTVASLESGTLDGRTILGIQIMLLGFFAMVAIGLLFVLRLLSDLKFQNHKKLLEIEYKLCDLLEKAEKK